MIAFFQEHTALAWTILASIALALIGAIAAAIVLVYLPPDYFQKPHNNARGPWRIVKNIAGWLLIIAGIIMLALPGPGAIVVLLGVMMADFPGKARLQRWLLSRGPILKPANWLRARFHKPPLKAPKKSADRPSKAVPAPS